MLRGSASIYKKGKYKMLLGMRPVLEEGTVYKAELIDMILVGAEFNDCIILTFQLREDWDKSTIISGMCSVDPREDSCTRKWFSVIRGYEGGIVEDYELSWHCGSVVELTIRKKVTGSYIDYTVDNIHRLIDKLPNTWRSFKPKDLDARGYTRRESYKTW
jgi:hypothetical protein